MGTGENQDRAERDSTLGDLRRELRGTVSQLLDICPIPMAATTIETGRFVDANPPFLDLVGLRPGQLYGRTAAELDLVPKGSLRGLLRESGEKGKAQGYALPLKPRGGQPTQLLVSTAIVEGSENPCLLWLVIDDGRKAPTLSPPPLSGPGRLRRDSSPYPSSIEPQLESVGRLAGAIAHAFSNLLSPIVGLAEMGLLETSPESSLYNDLEQIRDAASQANELTRQLLAFGSKQSLSLAVVNFNDIITASEGMLRRLIREDIEIEVRLHPSLGTVRADPTQLQQILVNLVLNARDAMKHGGKMTIETANILIDEEQVAAEDVEPGRFVMVSISDTGYGMDDATQSRVFEPFFTTKGQGQGMGLATAYGIVKQHGGTIWVYSKPGEGATLKVCLPRLREDSLSDDYSPTPLPSSGPQGTETILVVEDEDIVRRMVCRILATHGYNVLSAPGGREALEVLDEFKDRVHLLLTDVIMPSMNGKQLRDRVRELRPETKALYMSGYADSVIARHGVLDDDAWFLQKPFSLWDLTKKVREALDG